MEERPDFYFKSKESKDNIKHVLLKQEENEFEQHMDQCLANSEVSQSLSSVSTTGGSGESWGFKTTNTIFFLPFYQAMFGHNWRFIHLVRDGRDIAFGANHQQVCNNNDVVFVVVVVGVLFVVT